MGVVQLGLGLVGGWAASGGFVVPVLPLIDLLILIAWTSLMWAFVHKALWLALASRFTVLGLGPYDFVLGGAVCLLLALALAARTWVKANEPLLFRSRHRAGPERVGRYPDPRMEASGVADTDTVPQQPVASRAVTGS